MDTTTSKQHLRVLLALNVVSRLLIVLLVSLAANLPLFDSSPTLIPTPAYARPLLRWDAFHFTRLAHRKLRYDHEYQWAFLPGTPAVMRLVGLVVDPDWHSLMLGGALAAAACDSTSTLYHLTLHHFRSPSFAFLTSLLSLLPSSPATLRFACYSEPFFTFLSYRGLLACARRKWFLATCYFALASSFRSNGVLLAGFPIWGLVVQPYIERRSLPSLTTLVYTLLLTTLTLLPLIAYNYAAYRIFCDPRTPSWCRSLPPSIYTHVQSTYWHVGLFKYWTPAQLPNFILAAPVLALLLTYAPAHVFIPGLAPHAIHALILTSTLILVAHTQIALRLAGSMPILYWAAAAAVMRDREPGARTRWGFWWVSWSVVWGAVSVVLWTVFLPPA